MAQRLPIPALLLLSLLPAGFLPAQTLPTKTVAVPRGEQFRFLPSSNEGMGGLDIASDDPSGDPFTNPAVRAGGSFRISSSPTVYGDKRETVHGRTLPLAATFSASRWFGTFAVATQWLEEQPVEVFSPPSGLGGEFEEDPKGRNSYVLGSLGLQLGMRTAIGVKFARGELGLLDGARRLYPAALSVSQEGTVRTVTVGAVHGFGERHRLRATLSNSTFSMSQDVTGWHSEPGESPGQWEPPVVWTRTDPSSAKVWEGRVLYTLSIPSERVRLTALASLRTRDQDETPRYDLVQIPHDPGTSTVGEFGFGWEAIGPLFRLAVEGAFSPGTAHSRVFSDSTVHGAVGAAVQPGDPAFDTDLRFRNFRVVGGADVPLGRGGFQLGLGVYGHRFHLEQKDHVRAEEHIRNIKWYEWVPSFGSWVDFGHVEVRYSLRVVNWGTSPCDSYSYRTSCRPWPVSYYFSGLFVAPTDPEDLPDFRVTSHQLTVSLSLG